MKVAIVYPRFNLDTIPSLVGAAELFAERGYEVEVFTYLQAGQPRPAFASPRIRVRSLGVEGVADHSTARLRSLVKRAGWRLPGMARTYQALDAGMATGTRLAARARRVVEDREQADAAVCVIGVDPDGLELAQTVARGAPTAYYSLELLLSSEIVTEPERQLKARERELCRQAAFVIVQDEARAGLLAEDNEVDWGRIVLVPNAPAGPARRRPSRYWHDRFDLATDTRVVIHSGSLGDWTGIEAIVGSVENWPQPWVLVIHTRYDAELSAYVDGLRKRANPERVFFSLKPVPRQEYDPLIDGADVGLAFYVPTPGSAYTQRNVQTIGLSSGKLAYYLRAGLPVIVNKASSIAEEVDARCIGHTVHDAAGIGAALDSIALEYAHISTNAMTFFEERLDFRRAFGEVLRRVDTLR